MKKIGIVLVTIMLTQNIVLSQKLSKDFKVSTATPYDVIDAGSKEYISLDNGFVIMAKMGGGDVTLQKFDATKMKEVARNTYTDLPKTSFFQDIIKLEDRIYYIYRVDEKSTKGFKVYAREINTADAKFMKPFELIKTSRDVAKSTSTGELSKVGETAWNFSTGGNRFLVYKSFDESKVMISYRCSPTFKDDSKNYDEIGFYVFDNKMQKIWGNEVKMPYTEKQINNVGVSISKSGEAKMLIANREKKKYEMLLINSDGKLTTKDLGVSTDQLVRTMQIKEDDKGNFVCVGFYANGIEFKYFSSALVFNTNGLMYLKLDKDAKLIKNQNFDFSDDFIKQNLNERLKNKVDKREADGKAGIEDVILTNFVIKKDGSALIIGEQQYLRNEFWGPKQQPVYHFSNVIAIKIDANGKLAWMKKLAKNQAGLRGGGQMSIAYMGGETSDYIAYVDNPKNISLSEKDGIPEAHKDGLGGFLTTYKIDNATGNIEKHTLCDMNKIGSFKAYQFKVWRITKASDKSFLMEIYIKDKKDTMVKFELN